MVCPNCQSTDIVTIQGQNYCINCGQLVPQEAVKEPAKSKTKTAAPSVADGIVSEVNKSLEKLTGFESAGEAAPQGAAVPTITNHAKKPVVTSKPATGGRQVSDLRPAAKKLVKAPAPPAPVPAALAEPIIVPTKTRAVKRAERKAAKKAKKADKTVAKAVPTAKAKLPAAHDGLGYALSTALRAVADRRFWSFGLTAAILATLPASAASFFVMNQVVQLWADLASSEPVGGIFESLNNADLALPLELGQDLSVLTALVLLYLLLAHCVKVYAGNAIIYGSSKLADKRSINSASWANIGLNSLWGVVFIDVLTAGLLIVLLCANLLVSQYGLLDTLSSSAVAWARGATLVFTGILALGAVVARIMSRAAVVLGNLTPSSAYAMGWKLFWRRLLPTVGAAATGALVNLVLILMYVGATGLLLVSFRPTLYTTSGLAGTGIFVLIGIFTLSAAIVFNLVFWTCVYRKSVRLAYPNLAALLVARQPQKPKPSGIWALALLTGVLLALGLWVSLS